ncbi:MAG: hypothetical protein ACYCY6_03030, partial [Minisyncoccota bacterium]
MLVFLTASCSTEGGTPLEPEDPTDPNGPETPGVEYTLELEHTNGVVGTLYIGNQKYASGTEVQYNFTQDFGYKNLIVEIDGVNAPFSGRVVMSKDRKISVSTEAESVLPDGARTTMNNILSYVHAVGSPNFLVAYNSHLGQVDDIYSSGMENPRDVILAGYREALKVMSDEEWLATEKALSGKLFGPNMSVGSSLRFANTLADPTYVATTALIYVNGILNTTDAASVARKELELVVEEAGLEESIKVYNFYNASGMYNTAIKSKCQRRAVALRSYTMYLLCVGASDLAQSNEQIANLLGTSPAEATTEAIALAEVIKEERALNRRVILVGHSQGSLMIQEALGELTDKSCVRALSIAGPLGRSSWQAEMQDNEFDGFVVAGEKAKDIILFLQKNDFRQVSTDITRLADERIEYLSNPDVAVTFGPIKMMFENVKLHSMSESYLSGVESREEIRQAITSMYESMDQVVGECANSIGAQFYVSTGIVNGNFASSPSHLMLVPVKTLSNTSRDVGRLETATGETPLITDIAMSPNGELYGVSFDDLYKVDRETAQLEFVTSFNNFPGINSLTFDSQGFLYLANQEGTIVAMNLSNMSIDWVGNFNLGVGSAGDIAFSPDGKLYAVVLTEEGTNVLASIDLVDGKATAIGQSIGFSKVWGITFVGDALYGLNASGDERALISIDRSTGVGTFIRILSFSPT